MAEIISAFNLGRMNKDGDERQVAKGEYRDALNLDLATSDGEGVGVMKNIKGTLELDKKNSISAWNDSEYINSLSNSVCVGSVRDPQSETIYWFIASDNVSAIAEYNQVTGLVQPVIVDTKGILNFSLDYYITGVNILEGLLIWTDNQTEPKSLLIEKWIGSTPNFVTHSQKFDRDFVESDITVIRKKPLNRLNVTPMASARFGAGTGVTPLIHTNIDNWQVPVELEGYGSNSTTEDYYSIPTYGESNETVVFEVDEGPVNYKQGDIIHFVAENFSIADDEAGNPDSSFLTYKIVVEIVGPCNVLGEVYEGSTELEVKILSIPESIPRETFLEDGTAAPLVWEGLLFEENILFEDEFPRFSYRWKYDNNQYSPFAPFTDVVFLGGEFEYLSSDGHNVGMENHIRQIVLDDIDWGDEWVKEVEILYSPSHASTVYIVDEIEIDEFGERPTTFTIDTEIIGAVVEANQILRPYDNVPTKALAQEIVDNRIVYGNYSQQFDLKDPIVQTGIETIQHPAVINEDELRMPHASLKSMRTYQIGVNYLDEYGRETPVFTTLGASEYVSVDNSNRISKLKATLAGSDLPEWASHYKYWVKETSNEYYNLALDRYYEAEDGNVWLSFPSSEVNKLREDGYLILKKEHDSDNSVVPKARFKILAIESEAPDDVATTDFVIAQSDNVEVDYIQSGGWVVDQPPIPGNQTFSFEGPKLSDNAKFDGGFESGLYVRLESGSGSKTEEYRIDRGGPTGDTNGDLQTYEVSLDKPFGNDASWLEVISELDHGDRAQFTIVIIEKRIERRAEFHGRFFVKIPRTPEFDAHVRDPFMQDQPYGVIDTARVRNWLMNRGRYTSEAGIQGYGWTEYPDLNHYNGWADDPETKLQSPIAGERYWGVGFAGYSAIPQKGQNNVSVHERAHSVIDDHLKDGTEVRFVSIDGDKSQVYRLSNCILKAGRRIHKKSWRVQSSYYKMFGGYLDRPFEEGFSTNIDWIEIVERVELKGNKLLSSKNPSIWETEPKEAIDIDIYFSMTDALPIGTANDWVTIDWFNCYSYGNGVESNRIRDDYNAYTIEKNPIANAPLPFPYEKENKGSSLIWSQLLNDNSGVNDLNQFIQGIAITKELNPIHGSIQKLSLTDTNLYTLCEDKCFNILAGKDAIYNADGNAQITSNNNVLGQATPFQGEYGISRNPESFAVYGFQRYFTDKARGAVIRLSRQGITLISNEGMNDFFKDNLKENNLIIGSYNDRKAEYNLTLNDLSPEWQEKLAVGVKDRNNIDCEQKPTLYPTYKTTITHKEVSKGWSTRKTYIPENGISLNNVFYTFKDALVYEHDINEERNNFYGIGINTPDLGKFYESSVDVLLNETPQVIKGFKTLHYNGTEPKRFVYKIAGSNRNYNIQEIRHQNLTPDSVTTTPGWYNHHIMTDLQEGDVKEFITKEGNRHYNNIRGHSTYFNDTCDTNVDSREFSVQGIGMGAKMFGDVNQTEFKLSVCAEPSIADSFTGECVVKTNMPVNSVLDFLTPIELVITPKEGYEISVDNLFVGGHPYVSGVTKTQDGVNVILSVSLTGMQTAADLMIKLQLISIIKPITYTVSGSVFEQFVGPMTPVGDPSIIVDFPSVWGGIEAPYSVSGEPGDIVNVFTYELEADTGNKFVWGPILQFDSGLSNNYSITKTPIVSESGELEKLTIVVDVTIPEYDITDDQWNLKAIADTKTQTSKRLLLPTVTGLGEDLIGMLRTEDGSKSVDIGTTGLINGYGTITGNFYGADISEVTIVGQSDQLFGTTEITDFEIANDSLETLIGADPNRVGTFRWSAILATPVTVDSQMVWNIHVSVLSTLGGGGGGTNPTDPTDPTDPGPIIPVDPELVGGGDGDITLGPIQP